ncbi:MAG: hypothetical protein ACLP9L_41585 [Thermoguttaceae bacterium]
MSDPQPNLPTLPADVDVMITLPDAPATAPNPVDEIRRMQRGFRRRLVPFQKSKAPFRKPPALPADKVKAFRKLVKRLKRGLPIAMPTTSPKPAIE